jgi:hypothetical protein
MPQLETRLLVGKAVPVEQVDLDHACPGIYSLLRLEPSQFICDALTWGITARHLVVGGKNSLRRCLSDQPWGSEIGQPVPWGEAPLVTDEALAGSLVVLLVDLQGVIP